MPNEGLAINQLLFETNLVSIESETIWKNNMEKMYSLVSMCQKVSKESFDSVLLEIKKWLDNKKAQKDLIFNDAEEYNAFKKLFQSFIYDLLKKSCKLKRF